MEIPYHRNGFGPIKRAAGFAGLRIGVEYIDTERGGGRTHAINTHSRLRWAPVAEKNKQHISNTARRGKGDYHIFQPIGALKILHQLRRVVC